MLLQLFFAAAAAYVGGGLVFAVPFAWRGVARVDPRAAHATWGFRLLILPGTIAWWPLLLWRWVGLRPVPEERQAHRLAARCQRPNPRSVQP